MQLLQIILQTYSEYWNSVIQNAIGGAIGSIVAIAVSFFIYWLTIKQSNATVIKANEAMENNQLKAFAIMLQDAIKMTKKQSKSINEFIEKIKTRPTEFPLPIIYPLGDLKRITDTITIEKTGITYMKYFTSNDSAKEFTSILKIVDYLYAEFQMLIGLIERGSLNHYDRKLIVSKTFEESNKLVLDYIERMNHVDLLGEGLVNIKMHFDKNRGSPDNIGSVYTLFFVPISEFIYEIHSKVPKTDYSIELFYKSAKGIEYFKNIEAGYKKFEKEMTGIEAEVNKNLQNLEVKSSTILKSSYCSIELPNDEVSNTTGDDSSSPVGS